MPSDKRSAFQQQVVEALLASKAINVEAVSATFSKFAERALREGEPLAYIINRKSMWACGWPGPEIDIVRQGLQDAE
jgi:hypothetical protein